MCNAPCATFTSTSVVRESNVICPKCQGKSKVYNSRPHGNTIRRNRKCLTCGHKYATLEYLQEKNNTVVAPVVAAPKAKPVRPRKPKYKPRFMELDFDSMSDEELEAAIYDGRL